MDWKEWQKEHRSNFYFWLLGSFSGGPVMGAIGHAIANEIHGHPIDWALFTVFMLVGIAIAGVGLWKQPKQADYSTCSAIDPVPWEGYESEGTWRQAIDEQNRLVQLAHSVDGLFTPLQVKALRLAQDLLEFRSSLGNRPEGRPRSDFPNTKDGSFDFIWERDEMSGPWLERLQHKYALQFAPRVKTLMHQFGEQNLSVDDLQPFAESIETEMDVVKVRNAMLKLTHEMSLIYSIDPGARK